MTSESAMAFTQKDAKFFYIILCNMENVPQVNWKTVASQAGYGSAKVAQTRFGQIKKKVTTCGPSENGNLLTPVKSGQNAASKTSSTRKRKATIETDDDIDEDDFMSSLKLSTISIAGGRKGSGRKISKLDLERTSHRNMDGNLKNEESEGSLFEQDY